MDKFPVYISPCPIQEAVFEVRFSTFFPSEAVFGIMYQIISKHFADAQVIQLPILQLPEAVRQSDPNLVFQPLHRLQKENISISIGPQVLSFSNQAPYIGWYEWKGRVLTILNDLVAASVCIKFDRSGLRYINFLQVPLFGVANIEINLINDVLNSQSTTLRTEVKRGAETTVLQLSNNVNVVVHNTSFIGSVIDIDVLTELNFDNVTFGECVSELLDASHYGVKQMFFNLLKPEFLSTLEPQYKD